VGVVRHGGCEELGVPSTLYTNCNLPGDSNSGIWRRGGGGEKATVPLCFNH